MALTSKQKKQGAVVTAAAGALVLGGIAVTTLGSPASPAGAKPVAAAAVPAQAVPLNAAPNSAPGAAGSASSATVTVTAQADDTKPTDDTVFTVSGEVTGAQPGTKIRLQRQQTPTSTNASPAWSTLAYTTFTDKNNKFSFPVKLENAGSFNLRVLHPQDREGAETAFSNPFAVTVSASANSKASSAKNQAKNQAKSPAKSEAGTKKG